MSFDVELLGSTRVTRTLRVTVPSGQHIIEYRGDGIGFECVMVDGIVEDKKRSIYRMTPRFDFELGSHRATIHIRTRWWRDLLPPFWARLEAFVLEIDDDAVYVEGEWLATARVV